MARPLGTVEAEAEENWANQPLPLPEPAALARWRFPLPLHPHHQQRSPSLRASSNPPNAPSMTYGCKPALSFSS